MVARAGLYVSIYIRSRMKDLRSNVEVHELLSIVFLRICDKKAAVTLTA